MKEAIVISLGGSVIVPEGKPNTIFLDKFKNTLRKHYKTHQFIIVCGGGSIARKYISILKSEGKSKLEQSLAGIRATRMNALLVMQLFGKEANDTLPENMKEVKNNLHKNSVVICGALRYRPDSTSDGTAAHLANYLNAEFINMTNVKGLYSENPLTHPKARFIPHESWSDFKKRVGRIKFKAGQHFVLDQDAAEIISQFKIKTYIIGPDTRNIDKILKGKRFVGTLICG